MVHSLRFKIISILLVATLFLGALSVYSIRQISNLSDQLQLLAQPDMKRSILQDISTDLNKLQLKLLQPETSYYSSLQVEAKLDSLSGKVQKLADLYQEDSAVFHSLALVPEALSNIKSELRHINSLKQKNIKEAGKQLEEELADALGQINVKDSLVIFERISKEIKERKISDTLLLSSGADEGEKQGFFKRIFGKRKDNSEPNPAGTQAQSKVVTDTVLVAYADTVLVSREQTDVEAQLSSLVTGAFDRYFKEETKTKQKIKAGEQQVFLKSALIVTELEALILQIRSDEWQLSNTYTRRSILYGRQIQILVIILLCVFFLLVAYILNKVFHDLRRNEEYQHEILLNEQQAREEAENRKVFLANMSHEIRTPLTSIIGYAEMLDQKEPHVANIVSSAHHLMNVANEILDTAKIESGVIEIANESFDLTHLLMRIQSDMQPGLRKANLEGRFDIPEQALWVMGDPYRLRQVLYNLLHNAIKFTSAGYVELKTIRQITDKGLQLSIHVSDTGIGIPEKDLPLIFEQYKQVGSAKNKSKGTGLGLGIVKRIVELMNGNISVESTPGKGTKFSIELLMKIAEQPLEAITKEALQYDISRLKVVVIDDDRLIGELVTKMLESNGAQVKYFDQPGDLIAHLTAATTLPDLLISDIRMPGMNGYELRQQLVIKNCCPKISIALTANVLPDEQEQAQLKQFDAYVTKPIAADDLVQCIAQLAGIAPLSQSNQSKPQHENFISFEQLLAYCGDDAEMLKEVLQDMLKDNVRLIAHLEELLESKDFDSVADLVHKLLPRLEQLEANGIEASKTLESQLRNGEATIESLTQFLQLAKRANECIATEIASRV